MAIVALALSGQAADPSKEVTNVAAVTVVGVREAPPPAIGRSAPLLSVEQMASDICYNQIDNEFPQYRVREAYDATVRARKARIEAAEGKANDKEMADAELARQTAVNRLGPYQRITDFQPTRRDLRIDGLTYRRVNENSHEVLVVSFRVHNLTGARIELPPVSVLAVDVQGFLLAGQSNPLSDIFLDANASGSYEVRFHNPPTYTRSLVAMFAPPLLKRGYRGCDYFNPLLPSAASLATPLASTAAPAVGAGAPAYTPAQLLQMQEWFTNDSRWNFLHPNSDYAKCDKPGDRRWRELMMAADLASEAWDATIAAIEIRRDAARGIFLAEDVEKAELARQAAVRAMMASRARMPIDPEKYPYLRLTGMVVTKRQGGLTIEGLVTVTTIPGRTITPDDYLPPLRLTAYDRYGFAVAENIQTGIVPLYNRRTPIHFKASMGAPTNLVDRVKVEFAC